MYVSAILQDSHGFLWLGTKDGLNRYDGRRFRVFHHVPFDPYSLSGDFITVLREDPRGFLWVGTSETGANRFDPDQERFAQICHQPDNPDSLGGDAVSDIAFGRDGSVWVATLGSGLSRLVPAGGEPASGKDEAASGEGFRCLHYRHDPGDPASLSSDFVRALRVDSWGRLWIGTDEGLSFLAPDSGQPAGRSLFSGCRSGIPAGCPSACWPSARTRAGPSGSGRSAGCTGTTWTAAAWSTPRTQLPPCNKQLASLRVILATPPDGTAWGGKLWLGYYGGLAVFDPSTGVFSYPLHLKDDPRSLSSGSIISIFQDRGGVVWLGSNGFGLNKFDPMSVRVQPPEQYFIGIDSDILMTRDLSVRSFAVHSTRGEETMWIGSRGIFQVSRRGGWFRRLDPPQPQGTGVVFSILAGEDGTVWFGTGQGLFCYQSAKESFTHFGTGLYDTGGGVDNRIFKVFQDRRGQLWVITARTLGLFDPRSGRIRHYWYNSKPVHTSDEPTFPGIHEDRDGVLWLGTAVGLVVFDPRQPELHPAIQSTIPTIQRASD